MNPSVTLDYLISNSNWTTLYCSHSKDYLPLIKEAILRGYQVCCTLERIDGLPPPFDFLCGWGETVGEGWGNGNGQCDNLHDVSSPDPRGREGDGVGRGEGDGQGLHFVGWGGTGTGFGQGWGRGVFSETPSRILYLS